MDPSAVPALAGVHHVKIPVPELPATVAWYQRVFGYVEDIAFRDDDGVVRGSIGRIDGIDPVGIAFRINPTAAAGVRGFDPVSFAVQDRSGVEAWVGHLDALGIEHSPVIEATIGWILIFHDCNGMELHIYTWERHADAGSS